MPQYLKEVSPLITQDLPSAKYFACKNFIARLPDKAERPSAESMELIVGKIYKEVRNEGSKERKKKKTELPHPSKDLYLEFFGTETIVQIKDDSKQDRRVEYVNGLKKRKKGVDRYSNQESTEKMNQTVNGMFVSQNDSDNESTSEPQFRSEIPQNQRSSPWLQSIPENKIQSLNQTEEVKVEKLVKKKKKIQKKRHKSELKRRSIDAPNERTFLAKLRPKQVFNSHFASLDPYTSRMRVTQTLEFPKIKVEGQRSENMRFNERKGGGGFLPEITRSQITTGRSVKNLSQKIKRKARKQGVENSVETQKKIEQALMRASGMMEEQGEIKS